MQLNFISLFIIALQASTFIQSAPFCLFGFLGCSYETGKNLENQLQQNIKSTSANFTKGDIEWKKKVGSQIIKGNDMFTQGILSSNLNSFDGSLQNLQNSADFSNSQTESLQRSLKTASQLRGEVLNSNIKRTTKLKDLNDFLDQTLGDKESEA